MLMRYLDLEQHLTSIKEQPGRSQEALNISTVLGNYKTLRGFEHNNQILICGTEINPYCDKAELSFKGDELIAMPYTDEHMKDTTVRTRLYSNATAYYVGYRNQNGFGIVPYAGWEEHLKAHNIGSDAIKAIDRYLKSHAPADYK